MVANTCAFLEPFAINPIAHPRALIVYILMMSLIDFWPCYYRANGHGGCYWAAARQSVGFGAYRR